MGPVDTFEHAGLTIKIYSDPHTHGDSPRDWDHAGTIYMQRDRDQIQPDGDADDGLPSEDYDRADYPGTDGVWCMAWKIARHRARGSVVIPVSYAHEGGIYECDDDEADGYAYMTRNEILAEFPRKVLNHGAVYLDDETGTWRSRPMRAVYYKIVTPALRKRAEEYLRGEIETYNQWTRGDVYGYVIETEDGEHVDSLWSMYGYDYCVEEARRVAEEFAAERERERAEKLAHHARVMALTKDRWAVAFAAF